MVKFTRHFYKFKDFILNKNIPIDYRALYIVERNLPAMWRKRYNYHMYEDEELEHIIDNANRTNDGYYQHCWWENGLNWVLRKVTVKNLPSILDFDLKHPEIEPSDMITALILWGRGPAIVKKVNELYQSNPEYQEFKCLLDAAERLKKEKKNLPPIKNWVFR